jgi:hypothetical protein
MFGLVASTHGDDLGGGVDVRCPVHLVLDRLEEALGRLGARIVSMLVA